MAKKLLLNSGGGEESLLIDFTGASYPALPSYIKEVATNMSYTFTYGVFMSGVNGLCSTNKMASTIAHLCFEYIAPTSGTLNIAFRCDSGTESNYDYMTIHATTTSTQPSYSDSTNRIATTRGSSFKSSDKIATVEVTKGETYYLHFQYRKDSSGNKGLDEGCVRSIELIPS